MLVFLKVNTTYMLLKLLFLPLTVSPLLQKPGKTESASPGKDIARPFVQ